MDLVAGVRKEGSRGGRANFKWEDVKDDAQRENYLGHSLMAPVGRWQKGRDLSWYAKSDTSPAALSAAEARKEEMRSIKEAEQDAMSEALGYGPMPKRNANDTPLGSKEVEWAIKETAEGDDIGGAKGVGFGAFEGPKGGIKSEDREILLGTGMQGHDMARERVPREERREKRRRSGSRSRHRSRERRHRSRDDKRHFRKHRSRDRSRDRLPQHRSRSYERRLDGERRYERRRERIHFPDHERRRSNSRDRDRKRRV